MNSNMLRAPLIKSAALLAVISLLVYLTATSAEGSLWSSLGTLFMASLRIVQLTLGLIVSFLFCLAVLIGIFLGGMAIVSRESAAKMLEQLRQTISDKLLYIRSLVIRDVPPMGTQALKEYGEGLKKEVHEEVGGSLNSLRNDHAAATVYVENLEERLERIENNRKNITSLTSRMEKQDELIQDFTDASDTIRENMVQLHNRIDELKDENASQVLRDIEERIAAIEQMGSSLQDELISLRELATQSKVEVESVQQPEKKGVEHRLFAHLKNKAMRKKVEELVTDTLDKNMSYAQVIDHLVKNTSGKTADVIAAHPSLAKDYIRYRRKNS